VRNITCSAAKRFIRTFQDRELAGQGAPKGWSCKVLRRGSAPTRLCKRGSAQVRWTKVNPPRSTVPLN
jgi:hypothetical protein